MSKPEKIYAGFSEADRELLSQRVLDIVEKAFGKTNSRDVEPEGMHVRLNGQIYGPLANPRHIMTPFMHTLIEFGNIKELEAILSSSDDWTDGQGQKTKKMHHAGKHAIGIWETSCGEHIVKKVNRDDIYTLYAQLALLNPQLPFVPRIDAIIETPTSGVFVVMEKLFSFKQIPEAVREKYLNKNRLYSQEVEKTKKDILKNFGQTSSDIAQSLLSALVTDKPDEMQVWANAIGQIVLKAGAYRDRENVEDNIMFRFHQSNGSYEPVLIDPIWGGFPYQKYSPRYATGQFTGKEFAFDVDPKREATSHNVFSKLRKLLR